MKHPIKSGTRLVKPVPRLFYMLFGRSNPRGWADYHIVPERRGTLWIHCHGPARRGGANLEFVGVPMDLRNQALQLMFSLVAQMRAGRKFAADGDFAAALSSPRQGFMQIGTLRAAAWTDKDHKGMLRVVDHGELLNSGFPRRLFASHVAARAQRAEDPARKAALCRKSLDIFPGDFADLAAGRGADADGITEPQNRCNLTAYTGLADALCAQGRYSDACGVIADAIARCPGWAHGYRDRLLQSGAPGTPYTRFWRDANIPEIADRRRPAAESGPIIPKSLGFGARKKDPYEELLRRG